ncbi:hypothetical protein [Gulosibacter massiliensis]|uniref:hypothetical protein n=1 Tax=Gulosibacter massiliensis TaxID=2479839 RepID=UPI000F63CF09|nr:hypothetical protein [Gulosibacter massiliensis]
MRLHTFLYRTSIAFAVALTCFLLLAAWLIGARFDANDCDLSIPIGVSIWTYEHSWWPLGQSCVYRLDDPDGPTVVPPGYELTIAMGIILICGVLLVWLLRRWHKRHIARRLG